jgi:regulation of enolase protein 1 (concanavalin A-like superfamily)
MRFTLNLNKKEFSMSKTVSKFALTAGLVLAMAMTFSCSGDDGGDGDPSSSSGGDSSSGIAPSSGSVELSSSSGVASSSSSEAVTPSSSSEAGQELSSSSAVPGGGSSSSIVNTSSWYVSTDVSNYNGTSTVGNVKYADGKYIALVQENGTAVAKIQNYTLGKMLENDPPYGPNPFVEMVLEIKNKGEYGSLLSCDGFSYKYKGAPHIFKAIISLVADESYHNIIVSSASSDWTTVEIPFSDLLQNNWSSHLVRFELAYLEGYLESLKWLVIGTLSPNTGSLEVKDVQCLSPATMTVISSMTDSRDGKEYKTNPHLEIDQCVWFAENLDYEAPGSRMCDLPGCKGRLYDWETAMTACPSGWHLPTREEFGRCMADVSSGRWWSSSEYDSNNAYFAPVASSGSKNSLLPVRCLKD